MLLLNKRRMTSRLSQWRGGGVPCFVQVHSKIHIDSPTSRLLYAYAATRRRERPVPRSKENTHQKVTHIVHVARTQVKVNWIIQERDGTTWQEKGKGDFTVSLTGAVVYNKTCCGPSGTGC